MVAPPRHHRLYERGLVAFDDFEHPSGDKAVRLAINAIRIAAHARRSLNRTRSEPGRWWAACSLLFLALVAGLVDLAGLARLALVPALVRRAGLACLTLVA